MALTLGRWLAIAAAGFAIIPVLVFSIPDPKPWRPDARNRLRTAIGDAIAREVRAAERLYLMRTRDSVRTMMSRVGSSTPRVQLDPRLDSTVRTAVSHLVRDAGATRPATPKLVTDIVVLLDTATRERGAQRGRFAGALTLDFLLPRPGSDDHCIVMARVNPRTTGKARNELGSHVSRERLLGPCAFYEHFGHPGPRIDQWLRTRGWAFGQMSDWQGQASRWTPPSWFRGDREEFDLRGVMGRIGYSCLTGDESACLDGALESTHARRRVLSDGVVSTAGFNPLYHGNNTYYSATWPFGFKEITMLADMVRALGRERFARFWQSELDAAAAFQNAVGLSLAEWTHDWMERVYYPLSAGPGLRVANVGGGILLLLVGGLVSVLAARRRQIT